ncbi:COG4315 family predicted lipoprotein [Rugosimonospora africana]|uniref:Lipoprotein n=1 Tax=Rugosimonospora africana TaxID=556532 RepID=A0A8J3VNI4_9ACTN|nr:hypothetical protein [Rugosimonospora africana]GIH12867.1 lipoprotein [Rugosimonospora africana]
MKTHLSARRWRQLGLLAGAGAFVAACSSNTTSASPAGSQGAAPSQAASGAGGTPVVMTHTGPLGTYLTDGSGRTLYLFVTDTTSTSTCVGQCAAFWPPLTTNGTAQAGTGVTGSDLTTSTRPDGTSQVDYHGHPLYYFASDKAAGDTAGQGLDNGGLWWVVSPSGNAITTTASGSGGGIGY